MNNKTTDVRIVEVGLRDGLQNEPHFVPTEVKLQLINYLQMAGLRHIEVTSFVSPAKIPQLGDHMQLIKQLNWQNDIVYSALVPNVVGLERALQTPLKEIAVFGSPSETFSQKNINCSVAESLQRFQKVIDLAHQHQLRVRAYISCVFSCPYEGKMPADAVLHYSEQLMQLGCEEICLGDTTGVATAAQVKHLLQLVKASIDVEKLAMHFHDTYGQAIANIYASLDSGITVFDASISGLGGCPYAKGASGNVATEEVIYLLEGMGINTGISIEKLIIAGQYIDQFLRRDTSSKVAKIFPKKDN